MPRSPSNVYLDPGAPFAVVGLLCLLLLAFGGPLVHGLYFHSASASWEKVSAEVVDIENQPKEAKLHYRYTYQGHDYTGDRFQFLTPGTVPEKSEINARFHKGDAITIHVNPRRPAQSVVQREPIRAEQLHSLWITGGALAASLFYFSRRRLLLMRRRLSRRGQD